MDRSRAMKKIILIFLVLSLFSASFAEQAFSTEKLNNQLSRTVSLHDLFWNNFSLYSNALNYADIDDCLAPSMTFDGTWYTGYTIKTDYGDKKGGLLARSFGDTYFSLQTGDLNLAFGVAGLRYGVSITGITLNTPSNDHIKTSPTATDFSGTQYFQDVYGFSLGLKNLCWASGYIINNKTYKTTNGLVTDLQTSDNFYGVQVNALNCAKLDLLYSGKNLYTMAFGINPLNIVNIFVLNQPIDYRTNSYIALEWLQTDQALIDFSKIKIPLYLALPVGNFEIGGGVNILTGSLVNESGHVCQAVYGEIRYNSDIIDSDTCKWNVGFCTSLFMDNSIKTYNDNKDNAVGFGISAGATVLNLLNINVIYNFNYYSNLQDIPEVTNKNVFSASISLKYPLNYRL